MMRRLNVAIIGLGYWGPNYLRVLASYENVFVKYICDKDEDRINQLSSMGKRCIEDYHVIAEDPSIDAVFVITPASTHYGITKLMLENGKNVLVEKPLTMNVSESIKLCDISKEANKVLMVGHIYIYNRAIQYIKNMLNTRKLGKLYYGVGLRMGLGPIRNDADCIWDLAPHDLSVIDYLIGKAPIIVNAQGSSFLRKQKNIYDYANIYLTYSNGFSLNLTVGWYSPDKIRQIYLIGSRKMVKFDDTNKSNPLLIYDKSARPGNLSPQPDYSAHQVKITEGDTIMPYINQAEPLSLQIRHFLDCISDGKKPLTDGYQGARVVAVLDAIEKSVQEKGCTKKVVQIANGD